MLPPTRVMFRAADEGGMSSAHRVREPEPERHRMRGIFKGLLAGYGAKKLGGGCFSTILIFLILYWLLGKV
jgi:hypothetical protein